jgi:peptide/nickel transport system substrate-binding protein
MAGMGHDPAGWTAPAGFFPIGSPMASDVGMDTLAGPRDLAKVAKPFRAAGMSAQQPYHDKPRRATRA